MLSANRQFCFLLSIPDTLMSFFCLITLARSSTTTVNRPGESGHACLLPDRVGKAVIYTVKHDARANVISVPYQFETILVLVC